MGYNPSETGTITEAADGLIIGRSGTLVPNPNYRLLTVKGAGQQYTNFVYSSGGTGIVSSGAVLSGATISGGAFVRLSVGGIGEKVNLLSGGTLQLQSSAEVKNITIAAGGSLALHTTPSNVPGVFKIGGTENNIAAGTIIGALDAYTDAGGVLRGWTGSNSATFCSGIILSGAVCDSKGFLIVSSSAKLFDATVMSGGTMRVSSAGYTERLTVKSGGSLLLTAGDDMVNLTLEEGAYATGNIRLGGTENHIAAGTYQNALGAYTDENGVLWGFDATAATTFWKGIVVSGATVNGTYYYVSSASICGATTVNGGGIGMRDGAYVYNANIQDGGHIYILSSAANNILGGAETQFASGAVVYANGGVNTSPKTDEDLYAEAGVLHNLKLVNSGVWVQKLFLRDGITADTPIISNAGSLTLESGASVNDAQVYGNGWIVVSDGGRAERTSLNAGTARLILKDGGEAVDTVMSGGTMRISVGTVGRDTVISAGSMAVVAGGSAFDTTVSGGSAIVDNSGYASGGEVLAGGTLDIKTSGAVYDFAVNSGAVAKVGGKLITRRNVWGAEVLGGNASLTLLSGAVANETQMSTNEGWLVVSKGAVASDTTMRAGTARLITKDGGEAVGTILSGGTLRISANCVGRDTVMYGGLHAVVNGGVASDTTVSGGRVEVTNGGALRTVTATAGRINALGGAAVSGAQISGDAVFDVSYNADALGATIIGADTNIASGALLFNGTATGVAVVNGVVDDLDTTAAGFKFAFGSGITLNNAKVSEGGKLSIQNGTVIAGSNTHIVSGGLLYDGADTGATIYGGVITGLGANGEYYRLSVSSGIEVCGARVGGSGRLYTYGDAKVYDLQVVGDNKSIASIVAYDDSEYYDTVLTRVDSQAQLNLRGNNKALNTLVNSGTLLRVDNTATATDTTVMAGGSMEILTDTAVVDGTLTLAYGGVANQNVRIDWLNRITDAAAVYMTGADKAGDYGITASGGTLAKVIFEGGLYSEELTSGGAAFTNGAKNLAYTFDGTKLTAADAGIAATAAAAKLVDGATTINGSDKAAKWDATTTYSANVFLADGMTTGNAWLDIDGFANTNANLYGAAKDQNFAGTVNIGANAGTIKNLAAGAGLGGKVAGVKLTVGSGMKVTGAVYAGGMGDVTGETETLIEGGSFAGNVFAGALCNYAANATPTATGDIALTVTSGSFTGNLYAGAAVKAGAASTTVHEAGDITVELDGGTATRGTFCVYGGGYATGTTTSKVYEADDVAITINGGSWGTYLSGRGIFGGVFADTVTAAAGDVAISVTGGTMGNIYGGGWAQNGGTSIAGEVTITVAGTAAVNNVFGGGSYSSNSGGTTSVAGVNITVAGGSVANNIFAAGQNENSTVTGDVSVTFTGSNNYTCNVYGYGVQESATTGGDKTLTFTAYTGTLSGDIGGFDGIVVTGDTAATLSGETIDNDDWTFDYTGRTLDAGLAMLTFDDGALSGEVAVNLATVEQSATGWSIAAGLDSAVAAFGAELSTGSASGLRLNDTLDSSYGIYEGWGFTLENSTLKFKQLA